MNEFLPNPDQELLYASKSDHSITSLSKIVEGTTEVYFNKKIAHLRNREIFDIQDYYDTHYKVSIGSDDEDSLYKVENGEKIYRTDKQLAVMLSKISVEKNSSVLDYGCAKGLFLRKLLEKIKVNPFLFDVTEGYSEFWKKDFSPANCSTYSLKNEWKEKFDLVTSFYVFEHVSDPVDELWKINAALKMNGHVYLQVPNTYRHIADFIAVDHIHHYSKISIGYLLNQCGFEVVDIDPDAFDSAWVVTGKKISEEAIPSDINNDEVEQYFREASAIARKWHEMSGKIESFEGMNSDSPGIIYGAGFYGAYILLNLKNKGNIKSILDQNPHLHGEKFFGVPVRPPDLLDKDVKNVYVGLNPQYGKEIISKMGLFKSRELNYLYF